MYLIIITLPLIGALISGFCGRWLGRHGSNLFSSLCIFICTFFCILAFYEIGFSELTCYFYLGSWINSGQFKVNWGFIFDSLTVTMLLIITLISTIVQIYSIKYMEYDPHCPRFMAYLEIFTFFMIFLVTSDNLIQMFIGWEGVGLASYLLINFWYTRLTANQSAIKALIMNRIGDFGLILCIIIVFYTFQSIEYSIIFSCAPLFQNNNFIILDTPINIITLIGISILIGAIGKSAQLGLHTWLPDAMEGPTPVSALIHAATMVTAGVFLIIRFSPLLEYSSFILFIFVIIGSTTAFFASIVGIFQNDLKKVIAYSTCSQLGYMIFVCGISYYNVSLFHLVNHAFFKALLFLSAGSVIHALSNEQDMRRMGSLIRFLPITYSLMLIGSLALIGFPFLTGFYSKDLILEIAQISYYSNLNKTYGIFAYWFGSLAVFFTSFYSFRLLYLVFFNTTNIQRIKIYKTHEMSLLMTLPLILLALGSIFFGYFTKDFFIGIGTNFWKNSIFVLPKHSIFFESELNLIIIKWIPFFFSISGIFLATLINLFPFSSYKLFIKKKLLNWYFLFILNKKWYWDNFYNIFFLIPTLKFGYSISFKNLDKGFLEMIGPYGLSKFINSTSLNLIRIQTGQLTHYIFFIILGLISGFLINLPINLFTNLFNDFYLLILCFLYLIIFTI